MGRRGIRHLVGLLDGVRDDRPGRLLAIPGAIPAEPLRQLLEILQGATEAHFVAVVEVELVLARIAAQGSGFGW